ncbi:MAG: M55 family metallopeptidase [Candidatus Latescibacterota bacterium]|jgi:D-amino peptidase
MKKVVVGTDIEGVAGVVSFEDQSRNTGRYHDLAKRLATAEVNAAVDGLLDAGVEDILVIDGHGPGGLWFEDIHEAAQLLHGRPGAPRSVRDPIFAQYDACVMIGQHAMAGVATSNQNHTQSSTHIDYYKLNGKLIGEIAQFGLYNGALGLPLIFLSGEEAACQEAEDLIPNIVTTCVKKGLSRNAAISLSAQASRKKIRAGIKKAVENHRQNPIPPLEWPGPYTLEKRFLFTDIADAAANQPDAERIDGQTIRFQSDDIRKIIYR